MKEDTWYKMVSAGCNRVYYQAIGSLPPLVSGKEPTPLRRWTWRENFASFLEALTKLWLKVNVPEFIRVYCALLDIF
ncbi:hypothetical protein TNCT_37601 [Trichonephila clavata]|uniref:Uncharacterized protein n=1 Tax=Trichonephila clavata TaxID=2740835 RepID=A0A8X6GCE1_TRICU|nr:hypothetical protein TNCT_37601 [Trichonephila clavata]